MQKKLYTAAVNINHNKKTLPKKSFFETSTDHPSQICTQNVLA